MPEDKKVTGHGKHTVRVRDNKNNTTKLFWFLLSLVILGGGLYCLINKKIFKEGNDSEESESYVQKVDTFTINGIRLEMIRIQGGSFKMGSNDGDANEKPVQNRQVSSFYLSKYEVTQ